MLLAGNNEKPLYDYQQDGIDRLRASLVAGHRRPVLQAPTGAGKTRLAAEVLKLARGKDKRVVFTIPRIDLVDQTLQAFWDEGVDDIGVIQANHRETDWTRPVQIASIQTLQKRGNPEADLVIVDEAHLAFQHVYEWMADPAWARVPFIGLTATPWTKGMGAEGKYDDLIVVTTTKQLIDEGRLSDFRVFAPSHPDLKGVKTRMGDYVESQLSEVMSKPQIVGDVVKTWLEKAERRPTLVFGVDCAHAKHLQACFEQAGVRCGYQDAHTSVADRAEIRRQFHTGHLEVVCNIGTLTTGVDWDVRCISLVRPTKSEILYVQIIGRGLRTAKGKDYCLILDHSSTTSKLGFVTDIHHTALDDGKATVEERQAPQPKECPQCHGLRPAGVRTCPHCGFVAPAEAKPNNVEHRAGELVEFSRHDGGSLKQSGNRIKVGQTDISRADLYGMLRHYAEAHGYAQGWAAQKYRQATGHWPSAETKFAVMKAPCWELSNWIRSRQIAYAKMRAKSEGRTWR